MQSLDRREAAPCRTTSLSSTARCLNGIFIPPSDQLIFYAGTPFLNRIEPTIGNSCSRKYMAARFDGMNGRPVSLDVYCRDHPWQERAGSYATTNEREKKCRPFRVLDPLAPKDRDILLGQGRKRQSHRGNMAMDTLIEKAVQAYLEELSSFGKTCIVASIVQQVKEMGGRFLRIDKATNKWVTVEDSVAHNSVSCRFRVRINRGKQTISRAPWASQSSYHGVIRSQADRQNELQPKNARQDSVRMDHVDMQKRQLGQVQTVMHLHQEQHQPFQFHPASAWLETERQIRLIQHHYQHQFVHFQQQQVVDQQIVQEKIPDQILS